MNLNLVRVSRRAMATTFEIAIPYGTPHAVEAAEAALELIDQLEQQLTIYRDDSEVSQFNASGAAVVEAELFALLEHCAALTHDTAGAFDIGAGALVQCWGFQQRAGRIPTEAELIAAMHKSGMKHVMLNAELRLVKSLREGLQLNLGAIGKGYALDRAADRLKREWGIRSALLHAGGSSVRAVGVPPTEPRGWRVAIRHPVEADRTLGTVFLRDDALGTSAATYQHFEYNGKKYGHVLDPRTGRPAELLQSASCVASSAAEADAMSTAFFVAGANWTERFVTNRRNLGAILLVHESDTPQPLNLEPETYEPPPRSLEPRR